MINSIKLEILANKIEKTAILFELYKGLNNFFKENPNEVVDITFYFHKNSPKEHRYITFKSSFDEGQSVVFSNVFHFLHKCVSLFDPIKSPFGLFATYLINQPQEISFKFNKDNFHFIFDYCDDFDSKKEWLDLVNEEFGKTDYIIYKINSQWGKYPTMVFNDESYSLWQEVKLRENYIKNTYNYKAFLENANLIKKQYQLLNEQQTMTLKNSYLTIYEDQQIVDCIEIEGFEHIKGNFNKKADNVFLDFIKDNAMMFELNNNLTEKMLLEIFNN